MSNSEKLPDSSTIERRQSEFQKLPPEDFNSRKKYALPSSGIDRNSLGTLKDEEKFHPVRHVCVKVSKSLVALEIQLGDTFFLAKGRKESLCKSMSEGLPQMHQIQQYAH